MVMRLGCKQVSNCCRSDHRAIRARSCCCLTNTTFQLEQANLRYNQVAQDKNNNAQECHRKLEDVSSQLQVLKEKLEGCEQLRIEALIREEQKGEGSKTTSAAEEKLHRCNQTVDHLQDSVKIQVNEEGENRKGEGEGEGEGEREGEREGEGEGEGEGERRSGRGDLFSHPLHRRGKERKWRGDFKLCRRSSEIFQLPSSYVS
eukprot:764275-Hanusia_phi.AAC.2